jgi:DNA (cytosine-5)-methyltransferase 1
MRTDHPAIVADVVDLFAGAGGWDIACSALGLDVLGIDNSDAVMRTRRANALRTLHADVRDVEPSGVDAIAMLASPPCQTFSIAGKGAGRAAFDAVQLGIETLLAREQPREFDDVRTSLVIEPLRWALARIDAGEPFEWLALEQTPLVLPVWVSIAAALRAEGYYVATGILHAEQYGVPQTRRRAFLLANAHERVELPTPTHRRYRINGALGDDESEREPWVSMSDALGWDERSMALSTYSTHSDYQNRGKRYGWQPSATVTTHANRTIVWHETTVDGLPRLRNQTGHVPDLTWPAHRPATTVAGRPLVVHPGEIANRFNNSTKSRNDGVRLTLAEGAALQTFPPDFDWTACSASAAWEQIGNAIPPLLARRVIGSAALGVATLHELEREAEDIVCIECGDDLAAEGMALCIECADRIML